MKSDVMHSYVQMEPAILKNLVTEVRETVATGVEFSQPRTNAREDSFSVVQLWNIRRNSRYAAHTRNRKPRIVTGIGY
jgi:hypothetical protein